MPSEATSGGASPASALGPVGIPVLLVLAVAAWRLPAPVPALVAVGGLGATVIVIAALVRMRAELGTARATLARSARDRSELDAALRGQLESRDAVLAAMSEGVLHFDPAGRLAYINRAAQDILGRHFDTAAEVSPLLLREAIRDVRRALRRREAAERITREFETAGAVVEATVLNATPSGTVVVVLRDVTRARSVERLRRDFVANASHELKTPVASILALSGALRTAAGDDPEAESRFLTSLEHEAQRLADLVRELLELSRLETGVEKRSPVRFDRVIAAATERARVRAESVGLRLEIHTDGPLPVSGSEVELSHLVENLLDNAVRYTPEGGVITVTAARSNSQGQLTIDDTGIGISSRDLDRIFERFYRADTARSRATGGTGLGLSIVRHIAEAHGGSVECRSVLGGGSTFTVRLPLLAGAHPARQSRA